MIKDSFAITLVLTFGNAIKNSYLKRSVNLTETRSLSSSYKHLLIYGFEKCLLSYFVINGCQNLV